MICDLEKTSLEKTFFDPDLFVLPQELEASAPPESLNKKRDEVKLLISQEDGVSISHAKFSQLSEYLTPGDILIVNTSGTMNAALLGKRPNGQLVELHLSTKLPANLWTVELREIQNNKTLPLTDASAGETLLLPDGGYVKLLTPYDKTLRSSQPDNGVRIWVADLFIPLPLQNYLNTHGFPIRYGYVREAWDSSYYQSVFSTEPGSAEMPSAGRPFTHEMITSLVTKGILIAPILLHTGVSSLESNEAPYVEFYRVPSSTAKLVNEARKCGNRVIAVGTTSIRAIETVTDSSSVVHAGEGWTDLMITPHRGVRAIDGLITGLHEPKATHWLMLQALASNKHLAAAYAEAIKEKYLWHEFGDIHLLLK